MIKQYPSQAKRDTTQPNLVARKCYPAKVDNEGFRISVSRFNSNKWKKQWMTWTRPRTLNKLTSTCFIALTIKSGESIMKGSLNNIKDMVHRIQDIGKHRFLMLAACVNIYSMQYSAPKEDLKSLDFARMTMTPNLGNGEPIWSYYNPNNLLRSKLYSNICIQNNSLLGPRKQKNAIEKLVVYMVNKFMLSSI